MTCPHCAYLSVQVERLQDEALALRLQVADGPRARVLDLERQLARANEMIGSLNARLGKRKAS